MRKTVLLLALLSLTACGNSESADESDQTAIQDDTVIELEDTEDAEGNEEAVKADYFNKNPKSSLQTRENLVSYIVDKNIPHYKEKRGNYYDEYSASRTSAS